MRETVEPDQVGVGKLLLPQGGSRSGGVAAFWRMRMGRGGGCIGIKVVVCCVVF